MHREIKIKQFPIVTTHRWPKTRNERFVWENEQNLYRFLPLVHNHVQVIWVRTRIRCVTCVCARALAHAAFTRGVGVNAWRRACLKRGADAPSWLQQPITYFSGVAWTGLGICMRRSDWLTPPLALEKLKSFQLLPRAAPVKRRTHNSVRQRLTSLHSKSTRGVDADAPCEWGVSLRKRRKAPEVISCAYTSLIARVHAHTGCVRALRSLGHGCVQEVKNYINTVRFLTQTARFVS